MPAAVGARTKEYVITDLIEPCEKEMFEDCSEETMLNPGNWANLGAGSFFSEEETVSL